MEELNELFYRDPYCQEFEAEVLSCTVGKKGFDVVLSDTAFYPEGGGLYGEGEQRKRAVWFCGGVSDRCRRLFRRLRRRREALR